MCFCGLALAEIPVAGSRVAVLENSFIRESSGICASRQNPGLFWTHNDSGSGPYIFAFDEKGKDRGTFRMSVGSQDIEDIAAATINGVNYLLVANTGVNGHGAPSYLYLIKEPVVDLSMAKTMQVIDKADVKVIPFRWPNGKPINCESVGLSKDGEVFLATKTYPSWIHILQLTWSADGAVRASELRRLAPHHFKSTVVEKGRIRQGQTTPTGMDISQDGRSMVFIYDPYDQGHGVEFTLPPGGTWRTTPKNEWIVTEYGRLATAMPQPEGICYSADGQFIYATSEGGKNRTTKPRAVGAGNPYPENPCTPLWKIPRRFLGSAVSPDPLASL